MADDKPNSPEAPANAGRGRRRHAPTIDLTATEVPASESSEAAKESAPDAAAAETTTPPDTQAPVTPAPESETVAAADASPEASAAEAAPPSSAASEIETPPPPPPPRPPRVWPAMFGSAIIGGALVALALWFLGALPPQGDAGQQSRQIAALETTVRGLSERVPSAADANRVTVLTERLSKLEASTNALRELAVDPELAEKLTAAEKQVSGLASELATLKQRAETNAAAIATAQRAAAAAVAKAETVQAADAQGAAADRRGMSELGDRLNKLESTAQSLRADIAQQKTLLAQQQAALAKQQRGDRATRLGIVAELLKASVARGERYRRELDAAKALTSDPAPLAPLEAFADTGIPSAVALGQQLRAAVPAMRRAAAPKAAAEGGFLERLQVNAERLVRIQPTEERRGDDPASIVSRIDAKAARGDIAGALTELKALPAGVRAPAESWIKTAQARDAAIEASQKFAAAHVGALAGRTE